MFPTNSGIDYSSLLGGVGQSDLFGSGSGQASGLGGGLSSSFELMLMQTLVEMLMQTLESANEGVVEEIGIGTGFSGFASRL